MKICFLAPANNYHTQKWCKYFVSKGHQVDVISLSDAQIDNVNVHSLDCKVSAYSSDISKIQYLRYASKVKRIINDINPDIINAHYATSYGMLAALSVPNNFILSVWGTDIFEFPKKSIIHKAYLKYVLNKSKYVFSTSNALAKELALYTDKKSYITPFGVDMTLFNPNKKRTGANEDFTIGIVKPINDKYGIDYLINSLSIIKNKYPGTIIKTKIAGDGPLKHSYEKLALEKKVSVEWLGFISQEQVATEYANMDIAVFPSNVESFGVSTIEAEASGIPVIVSNVPGLLETTIPNESSIVVESKNPSELAEAIMSLYNNPDLRKKMGTKGREYVLEKYEYNKCFENIENTLFEISKK
ncbi:MAG: glycosyltransferase family 4 protein [Clostridia bacterium]|nr:glycosyltransferase family 4 protein [Clostridia bacterium]